MARPSNENDNWNYEVEQVALLVKRGAKFEPSGFYGNMRKDNGVVLGTTTDQYAIIQNKKIMDAARKALAKVGLTTAHERITVAGGGARLFVDYEFRQKTMAKAVGDAFGYRLRIKNSFDRTIRFGVDLAFMRLVCTNGMETLEREFTVDKKHAGDVDDVKKVDYLAKAMEVAIARAPQALLVYSNLQNVPVTNEQGLTILSHMEASDVISGKIREGVEALWLKPTRKEDMARNLYNLYNAATDFLTHTVGVERYEYSINTSRDFLVRLNGAALHKDKLQKLITPMEEKQKKTVRATGPIIDVTAR
jgi:hypothetical protein